MGANSIIYIFTDKLLSNKKQSVGNHTQPPSKTHNRHSCAGRNPFVLSTMYGQIPACAGMTLFFIAFFLLANSSYSQDLIKTMSALNTKMLEAPNLHIKASIKVFNTETNKVILTNHAEIKRKPGTFYKKLGNLEVLSTPDYYVTANHQAKIITYAPYGLEEQNELSMEELLPSADSLLNLYLSYEYLGVKGSIKSYKITPKVQWLKQMEIQLDTQDNLVKIHYDYDESVYGIPYGVDVTYDVFNLNAQFSSFDFSKTKFITQHDHQLKPSKMYSDFRIVDNN